LILDNLFNKATQGTKF